MLMKSDKKNLAQVVMEKIKSRPQPLQEAPENVANEVADSDELYMVAEEVMKALETRDIRGFKEAMQAMIEVCMNKHEDSEMESEDMSEPGME